jgi:hypothetical protein
LWFFLLSQSDLAGFAQRLMLPPAVLVGPIQPLLITGYVLQSRRRLDSWTTFLNVCAFVLAVMIAWPIAASELSRRQAPTAVYPAESLSWSNDRSLPDVYILILDGFGRADVLRGNYNVETGLADSLRRLGFTVADRATSNYPQTTQSISSLLNLEYLPTLLQRQSSSGLARHRYADFIARNRVFQTFSDAGYRIRAYEGEYGLVRPGVVAERPSPLLPVNDFSFALYAQSILPVLSVLSGATAGAPMRFLHRRHVQWTLDDLENSLPAPSDPPMLTFAHVLMPHPPFVVEADGTPMESVMPAMVADADAWKEIASIIGTNETYEAGYSKAVRYLDTRITSIAARILGRTDGRPTIVYIQGDHGPSAILGWETADEAWYRERLSILLAARFVGETAGQAIYPTITPINAMRIVLNEALGTRLELLDDRSYFSRWSRPAEFIDVTHVVK